VPARLTVAARGELEPERLREVFAPSDGLVRKVHVRHGDPVAAGAVLAEMRNAQLELESKRLGGELETARKRLAAIEAKRLQAPQDTSLDRQRYNQLTAEKEECAAVVEGIRHQLDLVESQQAELLVRSPIDGTVLTWDVESLLDARPVGCGDVLMSVGDLKGTWQARLRVPEDRAGELLAAREASAGKLRVTFALATDPGRTFKGLCERVGVRTEVGEDGEAFVPVIVSVDRRQLPSLVPGTEVVATIDCGRRSLGYVWLHDVIDTVRLWISF
jgi:multidrug efflux pump subunit AcrA (membrane-fusion protein)